MVIKMAVTHAVVAGHPSSWFQGPGNVGEGCLSILAQMDVLKIKS